MIDTCSSILHILMSLFYLPPQIYWNSKYQEFANRILMKKAGFIVGVILSLLGLIQGGRYLFDYNSLSPYGKGFAWGSLFLIMIGLTLIFVSLRKGRSGASK